VYVNAVGIAPAVTTVRLSMPDPITYEVTSNGAAGTETTTKLFYTFSADPRRLAVQPVLANVKLATTAGVGLQAASLTSPAAFAATSANPLVWEFTLSTTAAQVLNRRQGDANIWIDCAGIEAIAPTEANFKPVTINRAALARLTIETRETAGVTSALWIQLDRPLATGATAIGGSSQFTLVSGTSGITQLMDAAPTMLVGTNATPTYIIPLSSNGTLQQYATTTNTFTITSLNDDVEDTVFTITPKLAPALATAAVPNPVGASGHTGIRITFDKDLLDHNGNDVTFGVGNMITNASFTLGNAGTNELAAAGIDYASGVKNVLVLPITTPAAQTALTINVAVGQPFLRPAATAFTMNIVP